MQSFKELLLNGNIITMTVLRRLCDEINQMPYIFLERTIWHQHLRCIRGIFKKVITTAHRALKLRKYTEEHTTAMTFC